MNTHDDAPDTGRDPPGTARKLLPDNPDTRQKATWDAQERFLAAFPDPKLGVGTVLHTCRATDVGRATVYEWRTGDVFGFAARFDDARQDWRESLERIAMDRITDPQGNRGSDVLLMAMLNAAWPGKYKQQEVVDTTARDLIREVKAAASRRARSVEDKPDAVQQAEDLIRQRKA